MEIQELTEGGGMTSDTYQTIAEVAAELKVTPKRVQNMMCSGIFVEGVHFFRPRGMKPRFKASAVRDYIEGKDKAQPSNVIQLKRGSVLRIPGNQ